MFDEFLNDFWFRIDEGYILALDFADYAEGVV
jgi:hypothetical protein